MQGRKQIRIGSEEPVRSKRVTVISAGEKDMVVPDRPHPAELACTQPLVVCRAAVLLEPIWAFGNTLSRAWVFHFWANQ